MRLRSYRTVCIASALAIVAGCDPGALVKSKVPEPIKNLLTIEGLGRPDPNKPVATIDVVQPKPNSVHGSQDQVTFQANVDTGKFKFPTPPVISWQLTSLKDKKQKALGNGANVSKKLEAGQYEAEITVEAIGRKASKKVAFRVTLQMPGKVVNPEGKGVPGVEMVVTDRDGGNVLSRVQTDNRGQFRIEVPAGGKFTVKPRKAGLAFFPVSQAMTYNAKAPAMVFRAIEAEIRNVKLVDSADQATPASTLCPGEQALLSFEVAAKTPPKSFEVTLVRSGQEAGQGIRLDQVPATAATQAGGDLRTLKVGLPRDARIGSLTWTGHLRITAIDENDDRYSVDVSDAITVDPTGCFARAAARATAALSDGKLQQAREEFIVAEKMGRQLDDSPAVADILNKVNLNRALAQLMEAQNKEPKSSQRKTLLDNAVTDLNTFLRSNPQDERALFLKGLANYIAEDYKEAVRDFEGALQVRRDNKEANILRAIAGLKTGLKKDVSTAVDDLTQVLTGDPSNTEIRKTRAAALVAVVQQRDKKDDEQINTAEIPVPRVDKVMDLKKYVYN